MLSIVRCPPVGQFFFQKKNNKKKKKVVTRRTGTELERMTAISLSMQPASTTRMKHRIMNPKVSEKEKNEIESQ